MSFAWRPRGSIALAVFSLSIPALALSTDCLAPTEVTVDITTDIDCAARALDTGITSGADGTDWGEQPNGTTHVGCTNGAVGTVVLVPGASDKRFSVRVVGGVGFTAEDCVSGQAKPDPKHPESGCIVATRTLGFVAHKPLKLPIKLYAKCIGKDCGKGSTCNDEGQCVSDAVGDCSADGTCPEPTTVSSSASSSGMGGKDSVSATGSSTTASAGGAGGATAASSSTGAGGAGGCGDLIMNSDNCGACGHDCLGGACIGGVCQPVVLGTTLPGQLLGGIAVNATDVYWTVRTLAVTKPTDGVHSSSKAAPADVVFAPMANAYDVAVSQTRVIVGLAPGNPGCAIEACTFAGSCVAKAAICSAAVAADPTVDSQAIVDTTNNTVEFLNASGPYNIPHTGGTDVAVLGDVVAFASSKGVSYWQPLTGQLPLVWGGQPFNGVALVAGATLGTAASGVYASLDNVNPLTVAGNEPGAHQIAAVLRKGSADVVWTTDPMLDKAAKGAIRHRAVDFANMNAGVPTTLASVLKPTDVAIDDKAVYYADDATGKVYMLALPLLP